MGRQDDARHARVKLRRSGGLAGIPTVAELDTAELAPEQARSVLAALDAADLHAVAPPGPPAGPDRFAYELEVARGGETQRVAFGEADVPEALRPVVALLGARARPGAD